MTTTLDLAKAGPQAQAASARDRRWLRSPALYMTAFGFGARLAWICLQHTYRIPMGHFPAWAAPADPHFTFGNEVGSIAHALAGGQGFSSPFGVPTGPTAWVGPIYPGLCALVFRMFGIFSDASAFVIIALNSLFSAFTCVPLFAVANRYLGRRVALFSGWIWAALPFFMYWSTHNIWDTSLSALLCTVALWYALKLDRQAESESRLAPWMGFGLFWGIAALANPALLAILPPSLLWLAWRRYPPRHANTRRTGLEGRNRLAWLHGPLMATLVMLISVTPWLARNHAVFGRFVFLRSNFGFEFYLGNYHNSNGMGWFGKHPSVHPVEREAYRRMGELAYVAAKQQEAIEFVRQHPAEFLDLTLRRAYGFWYGTHLVYAGGPWPVWQYWPLSLLGLFGAVLAIDRKLAPAWLFIGVLGLYPIAYYLTYPQTRYRHAIEPLLLMLAVFFIFEMGAVFAREFTRKADESEWPVARAK